MPSSPSASAQATAIDRERMRLENRTVATARPALRQSTNDFVNAILGQGDKPIAAVAGQLAEDLYQPLHDNLIATTAQGRLRSLVIVQSARETVASPSGAGRGGGGGGGRLLRTLTGADGAGGRRPRSVNELAKEFIEKRLNLGEDEARGLVARYGQVARTTSGEVGNQALKVAERLASEFVHTPLTTRDAALAIRAKLAKSGLTTTNPYAVETVYRTTVQTAYAAGRWQANEDPAIQDILWGYEFSAVMDDRTTDLCAMLDGMRRPKDDPAWAEFTPPNHFNCRSTTIEIFNEDKLAVPTDIPQVTVPAAFRLNWGTLLRAA